MKKVYLFFLAAFIAVSCNNKPQSDEAEVSTAQETATSDDADNTMSVNTQESVVTWVGTKPVGKHNGTINIKSGELSVDGDNIVAGRFVIDMPTLKALDQDEDGNNKLTGHLKSADFFDVEKYPESVFEIVEVKTLEEGDMSGEIKMEGATHWVTGNLSMMDSVKAVTFPAMISMGDEGVSASALFNIDRTDWGVHYGNDKSLGDRFIRPTVEIGIQLKAN